MIAKWAFVLCGLLQLILLGSTCYTPERRAETAMQLPARFDAGPVNSCEVPATHFCSVDYSVPTSVATLTLVIEEELRKEYEAFNASFELECSQTLRDIRCAQRFPRCSANSTHVTLSSLNCTEMLSVCPVSLRMQLQEQGFCSLAGESLIGECRPVTEYEYQFVHCPVSPSMRVTRWMYDIMMHVDLRLRSLFNGTLGNVEPRCRRLFASYFCEFMGRCTMQEEPRVEVMNTYEKCEGMINW